MIEGESFAKGRNTRITFMQLQIFQTVVHFGTFTKAADFLYMTQPNVSKRIKALESNLGVLLFKPSKKNKKKLELTRAGHKLVPHVDKLLAALDMIYFDLTLNTSWTLRIPVVP